MTNNYPVAIPISINEETFSEDCFKIINLVKPNWDLGKVKSKVYTGGVSNKLVGFFVDKRDVILLRIYGQHTTSLIDRQAEINSMKLLHENNSGPELYATFLNGICYGFVPGNTLTDDDCRSPKIYPLVAAEMAKIHSKIPMEKTNTNRDQTKKLKSQLWEKLRTFDQLIRDIFLSEENKGLVQRLSELGLDISSGFEIIINKLEILLEAENMPVTFCHNDLLLGNIIYNESSTKVSFIDFEWAMPNYAAFDVANHFNEFAGLENPDFSKCPDRSFRSKWIAEYLAHFHLKNLKVSQETFERWVELCLPVSHLFWALCAVIQAQNCEIDFDFAQYSVVRYSEFEKGMKNIQSNKTN